MKQFRQVLESWPYRSLQNWKFRFHETNINDLLMQQIVSYLDSVDTTNTKVIEKIEAWVAYTVHKINTSGYYLIECDDTIVVNSLWDWANYIRSYPAIWHGTIYGNNKIYFIISHPEASSRNLVEDVIEQMRWYVREIKLPE